MDIVIQNLAKAFGGSPVIRDFSATLREHQLFCIMGPSGCGKTTLLNLLMGLTPADTGTISGVPQRKSAVFQEDRLCMRFSAVANVRMVLNRKIPAELIENHLTTIGLKDSMYLPVQELSGGMQRRVAIVRAILADSEIIFLDEPFKGLDAETKQSVMQYVKANSQGKTVILVTHDEEEAKSMGGQLIRL